jgi:hypothetical protein
MNAPREDVTRLALAYASLREAVDRAYRDLGLEDRQPATPEAAVTLLAALARMGEQATE